MTILKTGHMGTAFSRSVIQFQTRLPEVVTLPYSNSAFVQNKSIDSTNTIQNQLGAINSDIRVEISGRVRETLHSTYLNFPGSTRGSNRVASKSPWSNEATGSNGLAPAFTLMITDTSPTQVWHCPLSSQQCHRPLNTRDGEPAPLATGATLAADGPNIWVQTRWRQGGMCCATRLTTTLESADHVQRDEWSCAGLPGRS